MRVSIDDKIYEIEGLRRRGLSDLLETLARGVHQGSLTGDAEFTVRISHDGGIMISDMRSAADMSEPILVERSDIVTTRPADNAAAFEAARERGRHRVAAILNGPEMLSAEAFGKRLGLSRVAVNDRRQRREFLGLEGTKRGFRYPGWQIGADGESIAVLPKLFDLLGDSPWAVYRFLLQPQAELDGRSALELLRDGRSERVLQAAESVARGDFA